MRHWTSIANSQGVASWFGNMFEILGMMHIDQMQRVLGFASVACDYSAWKSDIEEGKRGAQIDLVIDRTDGIINICEMKFSREEYEINLEREQNLINKLVRFKQQTKTRSAVHLTFVTVNGVKENSHSGIVDSQVIIDDLFNKK